MFQIHGTNATIASVFGTLTGISLSFFMELIVPTLAQAVYGNRPSMNYFNTFAINENLRNVTSSNVKTKQAHGVKICFFDWSRLHEKGRNESDLAKKRLSFWEWWVIPIKHNF